MTPNATSRYVDTSDVRLHLHDVGDGPAVVLLHSSGPGADGWTNFRDNVPALSRNFRLLIVDHPGYGRSGKPTFADRSFLQTTSAALTEMLDALGVERVHLVGNYAGGATAVHFALDQPDRTDRIVLMGAGGAAVNLLSATPSEGVQLLRALDTPPGITYANIAAFLRIRVADPSLITDDLISERFRAATDPAARIGYERVTRALERWGDHGGLWEQIHRVRHEVLIVVGRDDRLHPLDTALFALRRLPHARLHVFPRCGNWPQLEHRDEFDRLLVGFLGSAA